MELKNELLNYRNITLKLIEASEDIELVESLIEKRQEVIDKIKLMKYEINDFKVIASELDLLQLEQTLEFKMKKEKVNAKKTLDNVRKLKQARSMYNKREGSPVFFNMQSY